MSNPTINSDGTKFWYLNDQLHREDGPAAEFAGGGKHWYINGQLHREDGPAIEHANGDKHWYINGEELTGDELDLYLFQLWVKTGKNHFV